MELSLSQYKLLISTLSKIGSFAKTALLCNGVYVPICLGYKVSGSKHFALNNIFPTNNGTVYIIDDIKQLVDSINIGGRKDKISICEDNNGITLKISFKTEDKPLIISFATKYDKPTISSYPIKVDKNKNVYQHGPLTILDVNSDLFYVDNSLNEYCKLPIDDVNKLINGELITLTNQEGTECLMRLAKSALPALSRVTKSEGVSILVKTTKRNNNIGVVDIVSIMKDMTFIDRYHTVVFKI